MLTPKNITAPAIPTTYIIQPTSDNSSRADVMITAVRTYFDMSIMKSAIFSQTEILFTFSFLITKIDKLLSGAKLPELQSSVVVFM